MAGRVSFAVAARLARRSPSVLTSLVGSPSARDAASAALRPPCAHVAAALGCRGYCAAGAGESSLLRCTSCGNALSANFTQGLTGVVVRARGRAKLPPAHPAARRRARAVASPPLPLQRRWGFRPCAPAELTRRALPQSPQLAAAGAKQAPPALYCHTCQVRAHARCGSA